MLLTAKETPERPGWAGPVGSTVRPGSRWGRSVVACTLVLGLVTVLLASGLSFSHAAPPPIKARPYGYAAALDVFPTDPPCFYANSWGAARSGGRKHQGVDIITGRNKPIYAVRDGKVSKKYSGAELAGNGIAIQIADGTYYFYAHLSSFAEGIRKGSKVKAGDIIGYVGSTGATLVPHIHFEIHPRGGAAVDPTPYVAQVDRCGYKGPRLKKIEPPTTTTAKATTTTAKPTTTAKATTTTAKPTTTAKATTTTAKPTTTVKPTTTAKATTTTEVPTTAEPKSNEFSPASVNAPGITVMNGLVRAKSETRVQISGAGVLPGGLAQADVKLVVSGTTKTTAISVSDCSAKPKKVLSVRARKKGTKTLVLPLSSDGQLCITATGKAKVIVEVRRGWTSTSKRYTVTETVTVLESVDGRKVPSKGNVIRVKLGNFDGLPAKASSVLISVTAKGGSKDSSVLVGRCGSRRKTFVKTKAGESATHEGWIALRGGDLCLSATRPTAVVVNVLGVS